MKSPEQLRITLAKQWQHNATRLSRLTERDAWPIELPIGKPSAAQFADSRAVKTHIQAWQQVSDGTVIWQEANYRDLASALTIPTHWRLEKPSQWIHASHSNDVQQEFAALEALLPGCDENTRELLIRKMALWRGKPLDDIHHCLRLSTTLRPNIANGKPLRAVAEFEVDTKFFERNERLLLALLDLRYNGEPSQQGLNTFLGAQPNGDHWLLIVPLEKNRLPFPRLRLSTKELTNVTLPADNILIIENKQCEHLLPEQQNTIAILGAGKHINWLSAPTFDDKQLFYWGDIDTWGLQILAHARKLRPTLQALLMNQHTFEKYQHKNAVPEPVTAGHDTPQGLLLEEADLYQTLLTLEKGRLEQEFISQEDVAAALSSGMASSES